MIDVVPNAGVIALGKQGENQAVRVTLPNIRAGVGSILLLHQQAADQQPYPVPVAETDGGVVWVVSSTDTAYPGRGQAELQWLGADGAVVKSVTYQTNTIRALTAPGAVPDEPLKPYTQAVARDAQAAKDAAASATEAARSAEASAGQAGLSAATATEAARKAEAIVGQAGQSAQSAQAAALAAAQNAAAAETAKEAAKQAQTGADAARTEAQTAKTAAEKASQEAKTAQTGAVEAKTGAETAQAGAIEARTEAEAAQAKAEEAAQGVAADREQIGANTAGLEAARKDVVALTAENTALKAETARTARSLDYLWKKSRGIIYDTETVTGAGSSVTVPSGAMEYAALRRIGGMSRKGRNLLNHDAWSSVTAINGTAVFEGNGVTITAVKNDAYTSQTRFPAAAQITVDGGDIVTLTWAADTNTDGKVFIFPDGEVVGSKSVNNATAKRLDYIVPSGVTYITFRFGVARAGDTIRYRNIMIQINATTTDWEPYTDSILNAPVDAVRVANAAGDSTNTYPIPQTIRDLCPDYGQGTVDAYNCIDFTAKTYHHVGSMSQDGAWTALATPEIIDLSAAWPDDDFGILRVEAGGTINLHYPALDNGYELAVPSETEIMVDVAKVVGTDG
nr:MAG TPA: hypothetical protein [Caudoviricetes sp.]